MTAYAADTLDLSRIEAADVIPALSYESTVQAFVTAFLAAWAEQRATHPTLPAYDVETLATDPAIIAGRGAAFVRLLERAAFDDRVRNLLLVSAKGRALDLIGTTYYGVARMIVPADVATGAAEVEEEDERYRLRLQLSPEAGLPRTRMRGAPLGTAKTLGGYRFHALSCDLRVRMADAASLARGGINVAVLAEDGHDPDVVTARVRAWLSRDDVKGGTDILDVRPAIKATPEIRATLFALHGPAEDVLLGLAERNLRAFAGQRGPFRTPLYGQAIDAALKVPGIEYLARHAPSADVLAPFGTVVEVGAVRLDLKRVGPVYG